MRHGLALLLGGLTGLLVGCVAEQPLRTTSWLERLRGMPGGPGGSDVVQMDVCLLERPVGDPYLTRELWTFADEVRSAALEDNGFRVGQLGGIPPAGLQAILTSERDNKKPRAVMLRVGETCTATLGPSVPFAQYDLALDGAPQPVELEHAEFTLKVVPSLTADGKTRLQFTPHVVHGEREQRFAPAPDHSGFVLQEHRPTKTYSRLGWEVTLALNEYVVVGARTDRPQSLGHQVFVRPGEAVPVQRLLAIRTRRPGPGVETEAAPDAPDKSPPLAVRAAYTTARGTKP